jgi:hypothetical protein
LDWHHSLAPLPNNRMPMGMPPSYQPPFAGMPPSQPQYHPGMFPFSQQYGPTGGPFANSKIRAITFLSTNHMPQTWVPTQVSIPSFFQQQFESGVPSARVPTSQDPFTKKRATPATPASQSRPSTHRIRILQPKVTIWKPMANKMAPQITQLRQ